MTKIWSKRRLWTGWSLAVCALLTGCESLDQARQQVTGREHVRGPEYQVANTHRLPAGLPAQLRRVALLPLVSATRGAQAEAGAEAMQAVLVAELGRQGAFEVFVLTAEDMRHATGRGLWTAEEKLPPAFLSRLRAQHACDAVLFSRLTQYRAYPPLAVGWSFKLVECPPKPGGEPRILWAADEVFDAGNPAVSNSARRHYLAHLNSPGVLADSHTVLNSPRRFAQYTLHALALTIPPREFSPQVPPQPADTPSEKKPVNPAPGAGGSE